MFYVHLCSLHLTGRLEKTAEEKVQLLQLVRKTELKWAYRCLWAMLGLLFTIFLLIVILKFGLYNKH